jgi:hypothetical protein
VVLVVDVDTEISGRAGTGGVEEAVVDAGAFGRENELMDGPRGVTRCLLEDAFSAGESGRYLGFAVRMNV